MSRGRPFNPYDEYPLYPGESHHPVGNMTDENQIRGLGPRAGDTDASHTTLNHPWGKVVLLSPAVGPNQSKRTIAAVQTEVFPRPFPWAIQARFSTDGVNFTPTIPGTWTGQLLVDFIKSFDVKTGPARESFTLEPGDGLPICALISRALTVNLTLLGEGALQLWVQFVVCPTTMIDCDELNPTPTPTPTPSTPAPYGIAVPNVSTRFPAVTATDYSIPAEPTRAILTIVNQSAVDLFVLFGAGPAQITPGDELATVVLPANAFAGYELAGYVGVVAFKFAADDSPGYALVTRGYYS